MANEITRSVNDVRHRVLLDVLEQGGVNIFNPKISDLIDSELEDFKKGSQYAADETSELIFRLRDRGVQTPRNFDFADNIKDCYPGFHYRFPNTQNWRLFRKSKEPEGD